MLPKRKFSGTDSVSNNFRWKDEKVVCRSSIACRHSRIITEQKNDRSSRGGEKSPNQPHGDDDPF